MAKALDLRDQAGQLLIMGFDGTEASARLRTTLGVLQPAGVILFARNVMDAHQTHELLKQCKNAVRAPSFLCVDMEGGLVDRLKAILGPAPAAADVFATGSKKLFEKHGKVIGEEVRALGFNTDFAPVLDLGFDASRKVLASRAVSDDPRQATAYAASFLKGLRCAGVLGCGKHFPGLGEANLDSHFDLPSVNKPWNELWEQDLYPYRSLKKELPFVMVAHANYPQITRDKLPASLSRHWITDVLRKKMGYPGIIMADDLEMGGVLAAGGIEHAAIETIRAGADMFLVCHKEEHVWQAYEAVLRQAERDRSFAKKVSEAARRVLKLKGRTRELGRFPGAPSDRTLQRSKDDLARFHAEITKARFAGAPAATTGRPRG